MHQIEAEIQSQFVQISLRWFSWATSLLWLRHLLFRVWNFQMCRNRRVMLHLTLPELFGLKERFEKQLSLAITLPMPAFKNTSWIKVCLVSISITIVQTGTVKISLQAYHFCCNIFQRKCRKKGGDPKSRNDRTVERRNGGVMERLRLTPNPKRRNDRKSPKILKGGMMENPQKFYKTE